SGPSSTVSPSPGEPSPRTTPDASGCPSGPVSTSPATAGSPVSKEVRIVPPSTAVAPATGTTREPRRRDAVAATTVPVLVTCGGPDGGIRECMSAPGIVRRDGAALDGVGPTSASWVRTDNAVKRRGPGDMMGHVRSCGGWARSSGAPSGPGRASDQGREVPSLPLGGSGEPP